MSEEILMVKDLCHAYGEVPALRDVNLSLGPGEVVGLIGRNGAGKSTLLRILAAASNPSSGEVRVFGLDPKRDPVRLNGALATSQTGSCFLPICSSRIYSKSTQSSIPLGIPILPKSFWRASPSP